MEHSDTNDLIGDFVDYASQNVESKKSHANSNNINNVEKTLLDELEETKKKLQQYEKEDNPTTTLGDENVYSINPKELEVEKDYYNRNPNFYKLSDEQEEWLINSLVHGKETSDTEEFHESEFAQMIRSIFLEKRNIQPIAFRIKEDGTKTIVFGETRWRAVMWLNNHIENTESTAKSKLYAFELKFEGLESNYQRARIDENIQRANLTFLDYCIQINEKYEIHINEFINNQTPKERSQKPEGYAYKQLALHTNKGEHSLKKIRQIGQNLNQLPIHLDSYGLYLKQSVLTKIASKSSTVDVTTLGKQLAKYLKEQCSLLDFDVDSIRIPSNTKLTTISKLALQFLETHYQNKKESIKPKNNTTRQNTQTIECKDNISFKLEFNDYDIESEKLKQLLSDPKRLETLFNEFIEQQK